MCCEKTFLDADTNVIDPLQFHVLKVGGEYQYSKLLIGDCTHVETTSEHFKRYDFSVKPTNLEWS